MFNLHRALAVVLVAAVIMMAVPVTFTVTVEAATLDMPEDPLDAAIAPHFSRVIYALEEPVYATSCDARGDFTASVGTPTISLEDSRLVISATAATRSTVVLATSDAPELNQSRAYYEMCLNVTNTLAYVNISLYDTDAGDWVNMSIQSGAWYYDYDSGVQQKGVLYSPVAAGTDYQIAFELAEASVTLFIYSSTGTLLADKYIATALLDGGDLDEIRFELVGSSSSKLAIDYFYALGAQPASHATDSAVGLGVLKAEQELSEDRVDLDPTTLSLDQSLREEMFGFETEYFEDEVTEEQIINALGTQKIHQQRAAGRLVADGYVDLKDSIEDELLTYIATVEDCDESEVWIVDYYIDYMQMKVKIDSGIVDRINEVFDSAAGPMVQALGGKLDESASTASILASVVNARTLWSTAAHACTLDDQIYYAAYDPVLNLEYPTYLDDLLRGIGDWFSDPLGIKGSQKQMYDYLEKQQQSVEDAYNSAVSRLEWSWNQTQDALYAWQASTDEKFDQVYGLLLNYMSVSQAQFSEMTASYDEMMDKFERTISSYYAYTTEQFEATNAIIAQLLLQNQELSEAQAQLTQYFAGEMAKTNEVIMNLTSTIASNLDASSFWSDVVSDGKTSSEPLTFNGFFGNNATTWMYVVIIAFVSLVVVVALFIFLRKGRRKGKSSRQ